MAQKKNYSRYFIILEEDEKGYSLGVDKSASGYVKLENKNGKCKISYYVQNIKKQSSPYHMVLICNKKGTKDIIKIGEMNIDEYGRADICYEYPVDNIGNSEINADKISGAAIVKFIDSNIISVMSGFSTTDIPTWKSFSIIESKEIKKEEIKEEKVNKTIFDKYEETIEEIKTKDSNNANKDNKVKSVQENKEQENKEKDLDNKNKEKGKNIEKPNEKANEKPNEKANEKPNEKANEKPNEKANEKPNEKANEKPNEKANEKPNEKANEKPNEKANEKPNEKNLEKTKKPIEENEDKKRNKQNIPIGLEGKYFRSLVEDLDSIDNITDEIKNCIWYKIDAKDEDDMRNTCNYDKFMVLYNPMLGYYPYIKKYGHYVLGYKCDISGNMKYLVYGIPGNKIREEQPFKGKSGFVTWIENKENNLGYWLMFYDYKTNNILIPVK